jgi:class 3 adenylate cyclase
MTVPATIYWILIVDIENFSRRSYPVQGALRVGMYEVVKGAIADAGLDVKDFNFQDRGDGILMLVSPTVPPATLVGEMIVALDARLAEKANLFNDAHGLRLRVALHLGLANPDQWGWVGEAVNTAFRLVDAEPLREVLRRATDANMALIVSDETYHAVIKHGFRSIDAGAFGRLSLNAKNLTGLTAWIQVPGHAAPPGLPPSSQLGHDPQLSSIR